MVMHESSSVFIAVLKHMQQPSLINQMGTYKRCQPHILMILAQISFTFLYFITEASFNHGMNPNVYITYRHAVSGIVLLPFAYFLERNSRPKLTVVLFLEIFFLSFLGVCLTLNMYFGSMSYTSPTFVASMVNTISCLTFILAAILSVKDYMVNQFSRRMEIVDFRSPRGIAKVLGTLISLAGVMTMTLYKGHTLRNLWRPLLHIEGRTVIHKSWLKGSMLCVGSCITWSMRYIMQASTLKRYPAQLSLTTWMNVIGSAQSAVYTIIVHHDKATWKIGFNIDFWSTMYGGIVISGMVSFFQLWCTEEKGPVFVTIYYPVSTILVAVTSYSVLGEKLYIGSIIGGIIVIIGLYLLLWGKAHDGKPSKILDEECIQE